MIKNFLFRANSNATTYSGRSTTSSSDNEVQSGKDQIITPKNLQQTSLRRSFSFTNPIKVQGFEEIANHSPNTSNISIDPYSPSNLKKSKSFTFSGKNYPILKRSKSVQFKLSNNNTIELSPLRNGTTFDDLNNDCSPSPQTTIQANIINTHFDTVSNIDDEDDVGDNRFKTIKSDKSDIQQRLSVAFEASDYFPDIDSNSSYENPNSLTFPIPAPTFLDLGSEPLDDIRPLSLNSFSKQEDNYYGIEVEKESIDLLCNVLNIRFENQSLDALIKRSISYIKDKEYNERELQEKVTTLENEKWLMKDKLELQINDANSNKTDLLGQLEELKTSYSTTVSTLKENMANQNKEFKRAVDERNEIMSAVKYYSKTEQIDESYLEFTKNTFDNLCYEIQVLEEKLYNKSNDLIMVERSKTLLLDDYRNSKESLNKTIQEVSMLRNQYGELSENFILNDKLIKEKNNEVIKLNKVIVEFKDQNRLLDLKLKDQLDQSGCLNQLLIEARDFFETTNRSLEQLNFIQDTNNSISRFETQIQGLKSDIDSQFSTINSSSKRISEELLNLQIDMLAKENLRISYKQDQSKKKLDAAQELIKKLHLTKSSLTNDRQSNTLKYRTYYTSNTISLRAMKLILENCWSSLLPLLYEDTDEYFNLLYDPIKRKTILEVQDAVLLEKLLKFFFRTVEDLVSQYKTNEQLLENELLEKSSKNVGSKLANVFIDKSSNKLQHSR